MNAVKLGMDVPNILSKFTTKEKIQEDFLAIEIGSESVTTAVWQIVEGKTLVVGVGTTEEWEFSEKDESLLTAIDASLAKTSEITTSEPNKVIFGLQEGWVEEENVAQKYAKTLKQICEKFEFQPIGFVVTIEAIVQLLKKQEGTPPTAILIRINEAEIQVSVIKLGKIQGSEIVARSEDIGADVEEGLARFSTDDQLPSQMLLYNSNLDLERLKQDLLSYDWLEKLPFLHFPKILILERQFAIKSVAIAGGEEAAKALGFEIAKEEEEERQKTKIDESSEITPATDITEAGEDKTQVTGRAEEIGFQMHSDVAKQVIKKIPEEETKEESVAEAIDETEQIPVTSASIRKQRDLNLSGKISKFLSLLLSPYQKLASLKDGIESKTKIALLASIIFFILLIAAGVYAYWTIPKAKVELYVKPMNLEKEITMTILSSAAEIQTDENVITGRIVETEVEGTKEKPTTGTQTVGEKAKGEIIIYNKTSAEKTFPAGTAILGPNGLNFSLDSAVTVASASAQETDEAMTTTFGKSKTAVTAIAIGSEYNLESETNFSIKSFSSASYSAKNEKVFQGGTSREVQAISQKDIDELTSELQAELTETAASQLEEKEGEGQEVLSEGSKTEVINKKLSGEVGEEANTLSATLKLKVITIAYAQTDFEQAVKRAVSSAIPEDFELKPEASNMQIQSVEFKDERVKMNLYYEAALVPQLDENEIKNNLVGRYPQLAVKYLESLPNFSQVKVEITPHTLPARLKTFPRKVENITIEVKVEE